MSFVSLMAVGKTQQRGLCREPCKPELQRNVNGILLLTLALSTGRTFNLYQTSLGSSQTLACFYISCAFIKGKLCAFHTA